MENSTDEVSARNNTFGFVTADTEGVNSDKVEIRYGADFMLPFRFLLQKLLRGLLINADVVIPQGWENRSLGSVQLQEIT